MYQKYLQIQAWILVLNSYDCNVLLRFAIMHYIHGEFV